MMPEIDPHALRQAFGSFMTGVTVVTSRTADGTPVGFTANSFTSVSLDPPLLLVCPGKFLSTYQTFETCAHFTVNILAEGQEEISNTFASFKGDRFARTAHHPDLHGIAALEGTIARFSCETRSRVPAGDHCILIGEVLDFAHRPGRGLGYAGGQYFSLGLERAALESASGSVVCGAIIEQDGRVLLEKTEDGYRPPQITQPDRGQLRQNLARDLAGRGLALKLGPAYSVFDDAGSRAHFAYFLASGTAGATAGNIVSIAISDLPALPYTTPAIADMIRRFAIESRTRSFALYLGDTQSGDIHSLSERK